MMKIDMRIILTLLLSLFISISCSKHKLDNDTLYVRVTSEPPTLDASKATDTVSSRMLMNLFDGLISYDYSKPEMPIVPAMAESWKITNGGKVYTFYMRKNATWTDGKPVTAHDFEFSWRRMLEPATASEYAYFLFDVKNAQPFNHGKLKDFSKVGVKALDKWTFQITLNKPVAYFIHIPTFTVLGPQRKDVIEKWGDTWTEPEHIITNGPYKLAKWRHDYEVVLERNDTFYGKKAIIKRIHGYVINEQSTALSLYETNRLDMMDEIPVADVPRLKKMTDLHVGNYLSTYYVGFNVKKPPFDNVLVRKAFSAAINKKELILAAGDYGQLPTNSLIPKGVLAYNPSIGIKFDMKQAHTWLEKAGYNKKKTDTGYRWVNKKTGEPFPTFTYIYNTNESHKTIAENLQAQWKKNLNIDMNILNQEWKVYLKALQAAKRKPASATHHLYRMGWVADYPDPNTFGSLFTSDSEQNRTNWKSKAYDKLVVGAQLTMNPAVRKYYYDKAQRLLLDDASAILPLYVYSFQWLWKDHVKNVTLNPLDNMEYHNITLARE